MIKSIIQLLRPHQWLKNLFIFLPLFFDRQLTDLDKLLAVVGAFVAYSLAASAIYCFNDIWDVEADRQHPKKCKRPIASGKISKGMGYGISAILVTMSLLLLVTYTGREKWYLFGIICFYLLLNIAYCVKLKQITIIDYHCIRICTSHFCGWCSCGYSPLSLDYFDDVLIGSLLGFCQTSG